MLVFEVTEVENAQSYTAAARQCALSTEYVDLLFSRYSLEGPWRLANDAAQDVRLG